MEIGCEIMLLRMGDVHYAVPNGTAGRVW